MAPETTANGWSGALSILLATVTPEIATRAARAALKILLDEDPPSTAPQPRAARARNGKRTGRRGRGGSKPLYAERTPAILAAIREGKTHTQTAEQFGVSPRHV